MSAFGGAGGDDYDLDDLPAWDPEKRAAFLASLDDDDAPEQRATGAERSDRKK